MSFPKFLFIGSIILFSAIAIVGVVKKKMTDSTEVIEETIATSAEPIEVLFKPIAMAEPSLSAPVVQPMVQTSVFPDIDRVGQLFATVGPKLPVVETITYTTQVPWLKGRPAWIADYAGHYHTSRHFIARSLNGKSDYFAQKISQGNKFNVFRTDKKIEFYLLLDMAQCKMGLYYVDLDQNERVFLKAYRVSIGKPDHESSSGSLTPLGKFQLGQKVGIFKTTHAHPQDEKRDLVKIYGTRWIPLESPGAKLEKRIGLHGVPWKLDRLNTEFVEARDDINGYSHDGSIQMLSEDIEELYAIVIAKPAKIEIVRSLEQAEPPGHEIVPPLF